MVATPSIRRPGPVFRIPVAEYRSALGSLHPSCVIDGGDLVVGDEVQLLERDAKKSRETGNSMMVTVVGVERAPGVRTSRSARRVRFAVNRISGR